jgi:hypothetical protein
VGDYENKQLVVFPADDLVSILNNIGDYTEVILAEGTHTANSTITLSGLSYVSIRGSDGVVITSTLTSGTLFDLDNLDHVNIQSFELSTVMQSGDLINIGGSNQYLRFHHLDFDNSPTSGSVDVFDMSGITAAQYAIDIFDCSTEGDIATFLRLETAHASGTSVSAINVKDCLVKSDTSNDDGIIISNSSTGVVEGCRFDNNTINNFVQGFTISQAQNCVFIANAVVSCGTAITDVGMEIGAGCSGLVLTATTVALQAGIGITIAGGVTLEQTVVAFTTAEGIVISGGTDDTLIACKLTNTGSAGTYDGIQITGGSRWQLFNAEVQDSSGHGIHIPSASTAIECRFGQCTIYNPGGEGLHLEAGTKHAISGCRITASGGAGILLTSGVTSCSVSGNTVLDTENTTNGITISSGADDCLLTNNLVSGATGIGIKTNADGSLVQGNYVIGSTGTGIEIGETTDVASDVTCQGNVVNTSGGAGLEIRATNSVISGNLIYSNTSQGIYEHSSSSSNLFAANQSHSNTGADSQYDGSTRSFGVENAQYAESAGESSTTSATYQTKVTLTSGAITGIYEVRWSCEVYVGNTNKLGNVQSYNNTDAAQLNVVGSIGNGTYRTFNGSALVTFTGSAKTFLLQYQNDSAGPTYIRRASMALWKVK